MLHRFFGGVHPRESKDATEKLPIRPLPLSVPQVVLTMSQHVGPPCRPVVKVGDRVAVGQVVGEPVGLGAPIHASVSGRVAAVEPRPHVGGRAVMAVVVENDGLDTPAPALPHPADPQSLTGAQTVELLRQAGLAGMGGAGFPTHAKLSAAMGKVDTLILNGAECEPYLTADHRLMLEQPRKVVEGGRILMRALGLSKFYIGVEANKMDAVDAMAEVAGGDVDIRALRVRYPQGSEKQLIQAITGRQIPPGGLPAQVGCAVFNVATAAAVYDAAAQGRSVTHRVVTVSGRGISHPANFLVPLGTPLQLLVDAAGGFRGIPGRILVGGPMMGLAQFDLSAPVMKGTNALLALSTRELPPVPKESTCLRCGRCVTACPMRLLPLYLHQRFEAGRFDELEGLRILDCIECGSCAFSCPAHIPLVQSIRAGKNEVRKAQAAQRARAQAQAAVTPAGEPTRPAEPAHPAQPSPEDAAPEDAAPEKSAVPAPEAPTSAGAEAEREEASVK